MQSLQQLGFYAVGGIVFLLVITTLVAVHELGHYSVARMCGMKVDAFAIMMGGHRSTDLTGLLVKPLAPGSRVWLSAVAAVALMLAGGLSGAPAIFTLGQIASALAIPAWVGLRIGALYHLSLQQTGKAFATAWGIGLLILFPSFRGGGVDLNQLLSVLGFASIAALLILYYQPVMRKGEESVNGQGVLPINGRDVPVQFRPLWSRTSKSGTEFSLLVLPLGGFAAISGMQPKDDGSESKIEGGFYSKGPFQRFLALLAGPLFSVAFGVALLVVLYTTVGMDRPVTDPVIGVVNDKSVAKAAGLEVGDRILSVQSHKVSSFYEVLSVVRERAWQPTEIVYVRKGKVATITVTPERDKEPTPVIGPDLDRTDDLKIQGKLGILWQNHKVQLGFNEALSEAVATPWKMAKSLFLVARQPSRAKNELGGPGTIAMVTVEAASEGFAMVLLLAAVLSVSLGVMNLLPIPPLDGGQMIVALVELLRGGRRLSLKVQQMIFSGGMILVVLLIVSVIALDVNRMVGPKDQKSTVEKPQDSPQRAPDGGITRTK